MTAPMKRLTLLALVFILGWLGAPVLRSAGQGEHTPYIVLYEDGSWERVTPDYATPTPDAFTPVPSTTPTITPSPTATSTPLPLCGGVVTADTLNVRSTPSRTGTIIGKLQAGDNVGIITRVLSASSEWWYLIYERPLSYVSAET